MTSSLTSSRIATLATGALVIDEDSGQLVRTDGDGRAVARLPIGRAPGLLAVDVDRGVAFVADREHDRVVVAELGAGLAPDLRLAATFALPPEPFGVALTPDGSTLLVSTIADHLLLALDARTGAERWRTSLSADPRTISISPDGARALVASIGSGGVDEVALASRAVTPIPFDLACDRCDQGPAFARSSGAVAFLDQYRAIAPFQRAVPESIDNVSDSYYGGGRSPVTQHLAFLSFAPERAQAVAQIVANQPRSLLWDATKDVLLVGGLASDTLLRLQGLTGGTTTEAEDAAADFVLRPRDTCGPDGFARAADGTLYVWCSLSRTVVRIAPPDPAQPQRTVLDESDPIAPTSLTLAEHRGKVLFSSVQPELNRTRTLACTTCHIDGGSDGHSWKIREHSLQTPMLAGRVANTAPYKWDGHDATIRDSIASTIRRLGGRGLPADRVDDLVAYLEAMPAPRRPSVDASAVARGRVVFERQGCDDCHRGPRYTDGARHLMSGAASDAIDFVDTPSLVGLAASAPYYHDGSARSLDALVAGGGTITSMSDFRTLTPAERGDLVAFLSSL